MAHEAPALTPGSKAETQQDARSRGWRTALQGLASTVPVALAALTLETVTPGQAVEWAAYGMAAGTAGLTAVAA